jgi:hypothetical protein
MHNEKCKNQWILNMIHEIAQFNQKAKGSACNVFQIP